MKKADPIYTILAVILVIITILALIWSRKPKGHALETYPLHHPIQEVARP